MCLYVFWRNVCSCLLFFNWIVSWMLTYVISLYILDSNSSSDMSFINIFFHSVGYLLVSLVDSFAMQKLFHLMQSQDFIFVFVFLASGEISKNMLLQAISEKTLHVLSSRIFMVSGLPFRSLTHFEFIFVYGLRNIFYY